MTNRTKSVVAGCVGMMAGGFTNSLLAQSELATSPLIKAGLVGAAAGAVVVLLLIFLRPRKAA